MMVRGLFSLLTTVTSFGEELGTVGGGKQDICCDGMVNSVGCAHFNDTTMGVVANVQCRCCTNLVMAPNAPKTNLT